MTVLCFFRELILFYGGNSLETTNDVKFKISDYLKFILPSLLGVFLLMVPFQYEGETTIMVALLARLLTDKLEGILPAIVLLLIGLSAVFSLAYRLFNP